MKILALIFFIGSIFKLDGIIDADEWKDAKTAGLKNGGKIYYCKQNDILYVALEGPEKGWAHVYLAHGNNVEVMHASAALGFVSYQPGDSLWITTQQFNWQLRDRQFNAAIEQKQNDHFRTHGWVASNNGMGDGAAIEFKIDLSRFKGEKLSFAALFASDAANPHYFPDGLNDETLLKELVYGNPPKHLNFKISNWHKL